MYSVPLTTVDYIRENIQKGFFKQSLFVGKKQQQKTWKKQMLKETFKFEEKKKMQPTVNLAPSQ